MGLLHDQLYRGKILPSHERKNHFLDAMFAEYRARGPTLEDFGVRLPAELDLRPVFALLRSLNDDASPTPSAIDADQLNNLIGDVDATDALIRAKTPLDMLVLLRRALQALVDAAKEVSDDDDDAGSRLMTDDFIPLLSFALTMSGVGELDSIAFYIANFVQSELGPEYQWTLSTFNSALTYLRTNPFHAELGHIPSASPSPATELPPSRVGTPGEHRPRHHSTMSMAGGPILSVHQTSSPPRRTASTTSLPNRGPVPPAPYHAFGSQAQRRFAEVMSPTIDSKQSNLLARRQQSGRYVPPEVATGIDVRTPGGRSRSQSLSEGTGDRRGRTSPEEMPPPSYPASSRSAGPSRIGSRLSLCIGVSRSDASDDDDDTVLSANSVVLQPPTPGGVEVRPQIIIRSPAVQRQPSRSYHHAVVDFDLDEPVRAAAAAAAAAARPARAPLGRAHSHFAQGSAAQSMDMRRSRSDGTSKRPNVETWMGSRSPVSDGSASPRSASPGSIVHGAALERTLSAGSDATDESLSFFGSTRKRLSSVTSSSACARIRSAV
jgi:hypothetical protein